MNFSAILVPVRERFLPLILVLLLAGAVFSLSAYTRQAAQQPPNPQLAPQSPPAPPQAPRQTLNVVVLDPGHGGPDAGARGASGVLESDVALALARAVRVELEREGLRVILTRQGNENPSFDERSAIVNGQHGAIFISLHVSSTGPVGSARVYSLPLPSSPPTFEQTGLVNWDEAQRAYAAQSWHLAELTAIQIAQKFRGSAEVPIFAPVRQLRTVAAPAIAIEVSSVSVRNADPFNNLAASLAQAVARAVADFRPLYEAGAK